MCFSNIKPRSKNSGFTIIEVLIVLAIAALIMTVVFYAIPQVQAARRDSQRKAHAGLVVEAMLEYWKNNKKIPFCVGGGGCSGATLTSAQDSAKNFLDNYFPESSDPSTGRSYHDEPAEDSGHTVRLPASSSGGKDMAEYFLNVIHPTTTPENRLQEEQLLGFVAIAPNYRCQEGTDVVSRIGNNAATAETDKFAVVIRIERGEWYCLDNS